MKKALVQPPLNGGLPVVQSVMVTGWNIGIAGGGIIGGLLLNGLGAPSLAWATLGLVVAALIITLAARRHAFPA